MRVCLFIGALAILTRVVLAQQTPQPRFDDSELRRRLLLADTDGNGAISREEAAQAGFFVDEPARFDAVDRDQNGTVTLFELSQAVAAQVGAWMTADTDRDDRVTESEAQRQSASFVEMFRRADVDRDKVVTRTEFELFGQRSYYRTGELPAVAPNIIEKRF